MNSDVTLIQMGNHRFLVCLGRVYMVLGDEHGNAGTLRIVILVSDIQNMRTNNLGHLGKDLG